MSSITSIDRITLSIIIPSLDREQYLFNTIKLLAPQLGTLDEILIINQGKELFFNSDKKIKIIHQKEKSLTKARNNGIHHSKGQFLLFFR